MLYFIILAILRRSVKRICRAHLAPLRAGNTASFEENVAAAASCWQQCVTEVESSRTSLASRTLFEVLGLGLEASSPWPWPRSLKSSKICLSSVRGQHYFLNRWNFVGNARSFAENLFSSIFFVFLNQSIGVAKGRAGGSVPGNPPLPSNWIFTNDKNVPKSLLFLSFSFFLAIFVCNSN